MKFKCVVTIDLPLEKVIPIYENPDNLKEWQDGFVSYEYLSGTPGTPGAQMKFNYLNRGKPMELIETIQVNNFPEEFTALYEHIHMTNTMTNRFTALSENTSRLDVEVHYTQLNGIMIKTIAFLMPWMFKKQVQKWLNQFKVFAERS